MKKVYENMRFHEVGQLRSLLEAEGIACTIRNAQSSAVMGEVPFVEVFPELWVLDDQDEARALEIVANYRSALATAETLPDWVCPQCGEPVPGSFEVCWNCGAEKPTTPAR